VLAIDHRRPAARRLLTTIAALLLLAAPAAAGGSASPGRSATRSGPSSTSARARKRPPRPAISRSSAIRPRARPTPASATMASSPRTWGRARTTSGRAPSGSTARSSWPAPRADDVALARYTTAGRLDGTFRTGGTRHPTSAPTTWPTASRSRRTAGSHWPATRSARTRTARSVSAVSAGRLRAPAYPRSGAG